MKHRSAPGNARALIERRHALLHEWLRRRARREPGTFARLYLPHYFTAPSAAFHERLFAAMRDARGGRRRAYAAPRGHAKSTVVTLAFALWSACTRRKRAIVLVSDTESQARLFLEAVRRELEANAALRRDFGDLRGPVWRVDQLLTRHGVRLVAKGTGSSLRGLRSGAHRPDLILCDDIENDENTATPEQRRKVWEWFTRALVNLLAPDGDLWVIGTVLHRDALLANLTAGNPDRGIRRWPGHIWKALDEQGRALWPAVWPAEKLRARRREIGSAAFAQEFQNEPWGGTARLFRPEWLADPRAAYGEAPANLDVVQAVDPALSRGERADFFCHVTLGRDPETGDLYLLDLVRERMGFERQVRTVIAQARRWRPLQIGIEAAAYQWALAEAVLARAALPVRRVHASSDKFTRALPLAAALENGKLRLPRGHPALAALREELLDFPAGRHDDQVDALAHAVALAATTAEPRLWMA